MSQGPEKILKAAYLELLDNHNLEGFLTFIADDGKMIEAKSLPYGGEYVGIDAIRRALMHVMDFFSDLSFIPHIYTTSGEWVIAYGDFSVRARHSGKSVSIPLAEACHVVDGKIKLFHPVYGDTAAILEILAK